MKKEWIKSNTLPEVDTFTDDGKLAVEGKLVMGKIKGKLEEIPCWVTFYPELVDENKIIVKYRWDAWDDQQDLPVVKWRYKTKEDE